MHFPTKTTAFLVCIVLFGTVSGDIVSQYPWTQKYLLSSVAADDGEIERDAEDGYRTSIPQSGSATLGTKGTTTTVVTTKQVIQNVTEYKPVSKTVMVTPEEYQRDSDVDGLVDAIDPSPFIKQSEFFTDIDGDGVPNALDRHHDEDDFSFFDGIETDANNNGILDSYEQ